MAQIYVWDFTFHLPESMQEGDVPQEYILEWQEELSRVAKKWTFQLEQGEEGSFHFQGRVSLHQKKREFWWSKGQWKWSTTHWSVTSNKSKGDDFYACKEESRIMGPWKDDDQCQFVQMQVKAAMEHLYPWQEQVLERMKIQEERTVNVLCCPKGNKGRSTFIALCDQLGKATEIDLDSKSTAKDMMRQIMNTKKALAYNFDLPRSFPIDSVTFWEGVEKIKKGKAWDDRYRHSKRWFEIPNIWVYTNRWPSTRHLSVDRWKFWTIGSKNQLLSVSIHDMEEVRQETENEGSDADD